MKKSIIKILKRHIQQGLLLTIYSMVIIIVSFKYPAKISYFLIPILIYALYRTFIEIKLFKQLRLFIDTIKKLQLNKKNITENKYIEFDEILKRMTIYNSELRQIINLVPIRIFAKDIDGKFLLVNEAEAASYGLKPKDMEGKYNADLYSDNRYPIEELEAFLSDDREVIESGKIKFIPEECNHDYNGTKRILETIKIPFNTQITDKPAILGVARDITEEKKVRKQLEDNFQQLKAHSDEIDKLNMELEEFQQEIVHIMIRMLEIHDDYTKGHSENVAELSRLIAIELKLSEKEIKQTYWAGILHDIGKTVVPKEILNKKSELTENEYDITKNHPVWGHKVLKNSKQLSSIANFVLYHHEKWDSSGYPVGLKEDEIPLISQILSIADTWDAMTSKRSYRDPLSYNEAIAEIIKNSGKQFNPNLVAVFLSIIKKDSII